MNLLLIGAGRMGLRHLRGLGSVKGAIHVVDPRAEAESDIRATAQGAGLRNEVVFHRSLAEVPLGSGGIDAAILAATAQGRLEMFRAIAEAGVRRVLLEKPIEQSRERYRALKEVAARMDTDVRCNGIHWLDFAAYITQARAGKLLFGEIEETVIASGRGPAFRDYGGVGVFALDSSRLVLSCAAGSSAPVALSITRGHRHDIVDVEKDIALCYVRERTSALPAYRYGADYERSEVPGPESVELVQMTRLWLQWLLNGEECALPTLEETTLANELLFDLLETSGETTFAIT